MAEVIYANDIKTVISDSGGISAVATSLTVADASEFPAISGGNYLYLTMIRASDLAIERVKATAISGSTVTITRAQEGTTALAFAQNDRVLGAVTKGLLDDIKAEMSASISTNAVVAAEASNAAAAAVATAADALAQVAAILPVTGSGIADGAVGPDQLSAAAAGSGLSGGAGSALSVNVDGSTIELSAGVARVKDAGITAAKMADNATPAGLPTAGFTVLDTVHGPLTNPAHVYVLCSPANNSATLHAIQIEMCADSGFASGVMLMSQAQWAAGTAWSITNVQTMTALIPAGYYWRVHATYGAPTIGEHYYQTLG